MNRLSSYKKGLLFAVAAYFIWGIFPLYWKLLDQIPAVQILAHRIVWSFVFLAIIIMFSRDQSFRQYVQNKKVWWVLSLSAIFIACNWGIYIYAVNNEQIVEASLGYYINPIVNIALGIIFLKERLTRMQALAVAFALAGLAYLTIEMGRLPVISLLLALSFGIYALVRKKANLRSLPGLFIETLILVPVALAYLWFADRSGTGAFLHQSMLTNVLLILAGPVTAMPLFLFGIAATKIPLSTMGFIQYFSPTIQLLIGVVVFKETFTNANFISFALVWIGLAIYSYSIARQMHVRRKESK